MRCAVHVNTILLLLNSFKYLVPSNAFSTPYEMSALRRHLYIDLPLPLRAQKEDAYGNNNDSVVSTIKNKRKKKITAKWVACSSTKEVTRAIEKYVHVGDVVVELGSQLRESSIALCETIGPKGQAVLVEIERKFPNEKKVPKRTSARGRQGDENGFYKDRSTFVETKEFQLWRHALFFNDRQQSQYNALIVDVSTVAGNDLDLTCISLIKEFMALNEGSGENENLCRVVIVKSGSLHDLARRLYHAQRITSGNQSLSQGAGNEKASIIGTVGVEEYRRTIPYVVRTGDICLEVGCHFGTSTTLIHKAATGEDSSSIGGCLGVDIGPHIIKGTNSRMAYEVCMLIISLSS